MDRRHQVFVSSTYADLIEERQNVIHALLELDCIPAGMELFPATDEDAWSLITGIIDDSDYYILILAGRYGSLHTSGLSYTELEYDYAVSVGKPIMAFLHEDTGKLNADVCEGTDNGRTALKLFRNKVQSRHCKFWNGAADLGGKVSRSLIQMRKKHPSPGWVPGRFAADETMLRTLEELRTRVAELEAETSLVTAKPPADAVNLEQGKDIFSFNYQLVVKDNSSPELFNVKITWDRIFSYLGVALLGECKESELIEKLRLVIWHSISQKMRDLNVYSNIVMPTALVDEVKVQLQALGLMIPGTKRRSVNDDGKYWKLSQYGEKYLIQLRARRRTEPSLLDGVEETSETSE